MILTMLAMKTLAAKCGTNTGASDLFVSLSSFQQEQLRDILSLVIYGMFV